MWGFGRARWVALVAAALVPAGPASAAKVRTFKDVSLIATGALTYTWNGDPARGCASVGACGIHGELILRPQALGQSASPSNGPVTVYLAASGVARVVREENGVVVGECADLPGGSFPFLYFNRPRHRSTTATIQSPPSSGRCAGPTDADLGRVSIPVRRTGRLSFDLTGTRPFSAGPFSGTLVSTMRLVPERSSLGTGSSSSSSSSGPGRQTAAPLVEFVHLHYRVSAAPRAIQTRFSGTSQSTCQILDACGTSGSLSFSIQPSRTLTVIATKVVHTRLGRRQVLNDLRAGRLALSTFVVLAGRVSEAFTWPDGSSCHDVAATPSLILSDGSAGGPTTGRTIRVTLIANGGGPGTNVFRTHCPGPSDSDLFGGNANDGSQTYAQGRVTTAQLLAKRSVLTLSEPGSFTGLGYVGSRTGSIALDLTLTKVTTETQR